jgi:intergrase/recombinase
LKAWLIYPNRVPKNVGARHYTKLLRQADGYYSKYATYLNKIRICFASNK